MRPSRRVVLITAGVAAAGALALLVSHRDVLTPAPLAAPAEARELVVLIRPGPVVYFPGPDGAMVGFDADLARLYAAEKKLPVRFVPLDSLTDLLAEIEMGNGHIGAGGLLPLVPRTPGAEPRTRDTAAGGGPGSPATLRWTSGYYAVEPVLIYNIEGFKPASWNDLDGETVAYSDATALEPEIDAIRALHPKVHWQQIAVNSPTALIAQVSDGTRNYAIVGSLAVAVARNIYLDFETAFPVGGKRQVAWAVPARFSGLREDLDRFLARVKRDGTLARLVERYVPESRQFQRLDASGLYERMQSLLPQYVQFFRDAQEQTTIEWRLLAALAYQESKWDPAAISETGVRGLMQITEDTARHLGIKDLLDPAQSVLGAARYLRDLKEKLPQRIQEPDRTWLALAAYNIGLGHLEDARILAQRQGLNPDHWTDVKTVLPLLALPEFYEQAKLGYARGGMPVAFVERVRGYYDVLLAHQPAQQPRLRMFANVPEPLPASEPAKAGK
jgi:membrane-bound lytic murein transglycosylase F